MQLFVNPLSLCIEESHTAKALLNNKYTSIYNIVARKLGYRPSLIDANNRRTFTVATGKNEQSELYYFTIHRLCYVIIIKDTY